MRDEKDTFHDVIIYGALKFSCLLRIHRHMYIRRDKWLEQIDRQISGRIDIEKIGQVDRLTDGREDR